MKKTAAQGPTPLNFEGGTKANRAKSDKAIFLGAALDMSWQMAVVVLVPVVGGFQLDQRFNTAPALTIVGFVLAMIGTFGVMRRMLAVQSGKESAKPKGRQ